MFNRQNCTRFLKRFGFSALANKTKGDQSKKTTNFLPATHSKLQQIVSQSYRIVDGNFLDQ